jgi:outer membrane lipoprotein-sorting protein
MTKLRLLVSSCALLLALLPAAAFAADNKESPEDVLRAIDKRMAFTSDYKGVVRMREVRKDGVERISELQIYRRDASQNLLFLITQPRNLAGGGYLRIGRNLWEYDPTQGQWNRATRRANIVGTISCEGDFDRSRLTEDYVPKDEGVETIDGVAYRKLLLTAKPDAEVTFPLLRLWVDPDHNIVKRQGMAPSGKTLRTDVIRAYQRLKDPITNQYVYHFREVLEFEEEEGTRLEVKYEEVQLAPLDANIFTKSWLEGRLR